MQHVSAAQHIGQAPLWQASMHDNRHERPVCQGSRKELRTELKRAVPMQQGSVVQHVVWALLWQAGSTLCMTALSARAHTI